MFLLLLGEARASGHLPEAFLPGSLGRCGSHEGAKPMRYDPVETGWDWTAGPQPADRHEVVGALSIICLAVVLVLALLWLVLE